MLAGKTVLITGSARRIGRSLALCAARSGADIVLHHAHSPEEAAATAAEIHALNRKCLVLTADLNIPSQAAQLIENANAWQPVDILVNNAAIFEAVGPMETSLQSWDTHLRINLTAPFLLSQAFRQALAPEKTGRIINLLDWRALRPGPDHFPYTISKAGLAALTRSLAAAFAPQITVNALALGAILPPSTGQMPTRILETIPAGRWADLDEVNQAFLFLASGPAYITGEILHVDGGRHLV